MKVELSVLLILAAAVSGGLTRIHPEDAIVDIGRNRQLFLDSRWLQKARGVERRLHEPVRREVVIRADGPADRGGVSYSVVLRDGEKFRMWYRADPADSKRLELNYATSAVGFVKVEIQDESGKPISEFSERESEDIFGDHIERQVVWGAGRLGDLTSLANRVARLRFVLRDADLYAFRFAD